MQVFLDLQEDLLLKIIIKKKSNKLNQDIVESSLTGTNHNQKINL